MGGVHEIMRFSVWKGASVPRDSDSLRREKKFLQIATFTFNLQKMYGFFHTVRLHLLRAILPNPIAADGRPVIYNQSALDPVFNNLVKAVQAGDNQIFSKSAKYCSLLIPAVRILFLIISTSISSYSGMTITRFAPG